MLYSFIDYIKFKLDCFRYYLGFRTPQERWLDGYNYAWEELLADREPVISTIDKNEFDHGVIDAIQRYKRNRQTTTTTNKLTKELQ